MRLLVLAAALLAAGVGFALREGETMATAFRVRSPLEGRSCAILGATGATGQHVLAEVLARDKWERVLVIGRRELPDDVAKHPKVTSLVVDDFDALDGSAFQGVEVFFNCIGTTRAQAGSADKFHEIEVGITEKVARAAAAAGVQHGSVISAMGADPDRSVAPKWFHPLFYGKTIGLKEKAMIEAGFRRVTVMRPGMLQRGDPSRGAERIFASILPSLDVRLLAKAMVNDAEAAPATGQEDPLYISGNGVLSELAALD